MKSLLTIVALAASAAASHLQTLQTLANIMADRTLSHMVDNTSTPVRFDGEQVWRVDIKNEEALEKLLLLQETVPTLDFWSDPRLGTGADLRIINEGAGEVVSSFLANYGITYAVMISDVQVAVDEQNVSGPPTPASALDGIDGDTSNQIVFKSNIKRISSANDKFKDHFSKYQTIEGILAFLDSLKGTYPSMVEIFDIGKTYEGRGQRAIKIRAPVEEGAKRLNKKEFVFHGGHHAREWIGPAVVQYIAAELLRSYGKDAEVTKILNEFDFTIIPVVNVDGYVYTHTKNRMWRKNKQPNKGTFCIGTDPNRNWDAKWGGGGASGNPCSESYYGSAPFSAPEPLNVAKYLLSRAPNVISYIDFHAYSQLWMYPYGYSCNLDPKDTVINAAKDAAKALKEVHGKSFAVGSICRIIYPASGSSVDWAYDTANVTYPYGVELRDQGQYGFLLPAKQIVPSGEETFASIKALVNRIMKDSA
ncbi:carbamoyl-phosphate synthase (glutamine-hydrolyzing) cpa2 [Chytridiales sp. JEL 0842]|nr:carbamoyl-phosphate synthase (glutamine-hydrolyzing) cpa2 [Chytridiales sp. JEL 0842]